MQHLRALYSVLVVPVVPNILRQSIKHSFGMRDVTTRLQAFRRSGFSCTGAIDVGAFNGDWTREFWNVPWR